MKETLLETERCILKTLSPAYIHEVFKTMDKKEIMESFQLDEKGYQLYLTMHEKGMETYRYSAFFFMIINKETNLTIGECGYHTINLTHARAEIFYILRRDEDKQKGYMSEVLPTVLNFGYNELNLHRIEALVASWNIPSVKLLNRFGFTKEGTKREDYLVENKFESSDIYSLLKEEWFNNSDIY